MAAGFVSHTSIHRVFLYGKYRDANAFSDLRHIIANAALSDDFNAVCNKQQKLPRKSFVDALLRMVG